MSKRRDGDFNMSLISPDRKIKKLDMDELDDLDELD